jgi:hypothetical protein
MTGDHQQKGSARKRRKNRVDSDAIEWKEYQQIPPGDYRAYCTWADWYWDHGYHRWACLLRWDVLRDDLQGLIARVPQWFSLGAGDKPVASRRGKYLVEWVRAKGGPPARRDRLSPRVFVRRMARVKIADTESPAPYSVVRRIIEWETGLPSNSVNKSHSQGRPRLNRIGRDTLSEYLSDCEASAPARVEGEPTPTHTQGAGAPKSANPPKAHHSPDQDVED